MNEELRIENRASEIPKPEKLSGAQRKQFARQGRLVKLAMPKPRRIKVRPVPNVQMVRGPVGADTYGDLRQAFKLRKQVKHGERFYRVAYVHVQAGKFEARLVEAV